MTAAKFVVAVLFAAALAAYDGLSDGHFTNVEYVGLVVAAATAAGVWLAQNAPTNMAAKAVVAVVGAAAAFLATTIADGVSAQDWIQLLILAVGAAGVYVTPNRAQVVQPAA